MACKIYVAEDEPPILRDLIHKIESLGPSYRVVGHACNGEDALAGIRDLRPDVLLTDIHMPSRDGLSLIEAAKTELPGLVCLILSGYREFEFARHALQLGVDEYLVKPVSAEALTKALQAAKSKADERYNRDMNALLTALVRRERSASGYPADVRRLRLLYVVLNHPFRKLPDSAESRRILAASWAEGGLGGLLSGLRERPEAPVWILDGSFDNEKILAFGDSDLEFRRLEDVWRLIAGGAAERSWYATGAEGRCELTASDLTAEIDRLGSVARESAAIGRTRLLSAPETKVHSRMTAAEENMVAMLSRNGQTAQLLAAVDRLMERWEEERLPSMALEGYLAGLLNVVARNVNHIGLSDGRNAEKLVEDMFSVCRDAASLRRAYAAAIGNAMETISETGKTDYEGAVRLVCEYIETHYPNKLTLRGLAQQFGLSESHLCKLFKKYKDESPIDYLLKVRIEQSKRLIEENPGFMFKEIAEMVGFADQYYYSRVFRNYAGCTPSEYRTLVSK